MTQSEVEIVARKIRTRCLYSSWSDLVAFWQGVMDNLEGAYRAEVLGAGTSRQASSGNSVGEQPTVRDHLALALSKLAGEEQFARWHAETMRDSSVSGGMIQP